eukprot:PhM_4_TR12549/c0_g2_i1/m.58374
MKGNGVVDDREQQGVLNPPDASAGSGEENNKNINNNINNNNNNQNSDNMNVNNNNNNNAGGDSQQIQDASKEPSASGDPELGVSGGGTAPPATDPHNTDAASDGSNNNNPPGISKERQLHYLHLMLDRLYPSASPGPDYKSYKERSVLWWVEPDVEAKKEVPTKLASFYGHPARAVFSIGSISANSKKAATRPTYVLRNPKDANLRVQSAKMARLSREARAQYYAARKKHQQQQPPQHSGAPDVVVASADPHNSFASEEQEVNALIARMHCPHELGAAIVPPTATVLPSHDGVKYTAVVLAVTARFLLTVLSKGSTGAKAVTEFVYTHTLHGNGMLIVTDMRRAVSTTALSKELSGLGWAMNDPVAESNVWVIGSPLQDDEQAAHVTTLDVQAQARMWECTNPQRFAPLCEHNNLLVLSKLQLGSKTAIYRGRVGGDDGVEVAIKHFHYWHYLTFKGFLHFAATSAERSSTLINYPQGACLSRQHDNTVFQVQPLLRGTDLMKLRAHEVTDPSKTMTWKRRMNIVMQLLCIFDHLHNHPSGPYTYDDIHPAQFFYLGDATGRPDGVTLVDIDTLQHAQHTKTRENACRCFYCNGGRALCIFMNSPEGYRYCGQGGLIADKNIRCGTSTDMWFIGQLLYYLLPGGNHVPFSGFSENKLVDTLVNTDKRPKMDLGHPPLPQHASLYIDAVVNMWKGERSKRPTVEAVRQQLRPLCVEVGCDYGLDASCQAFLREGDEHAATYSGFY